MLGMFIILPVFALYAEHLPGGNSHTLIGIALGAYGLTQAVLQILLAGSRPHRPQTGNRGRFVLLQSAVLLRRERTISIGSSSGG